MNRSLNHASKIASKTSSKTVAKTSKFDLLEALEGREMFSAMTLDIAVEQTSVGPSIVVNGTNRSEKISVTQNGSTITISDGKTNQRINDKTVGTLIINGGAGNDIIRVSAGVKMNVIINGGAGNDVIAGGAGKDQLIGGNGNDRIYGNAGNDVLCGGNGNDQLYGGAGKDQLVGGAGDDTLIAVGGGSNDSLEGDGGFDSYWMDDAANEKVIDAPDANEIYTGAVHRVDAFASFIDNDGNEQTVSSELNGGDLPDPMLALDDNGNQTSDGYYNLSNFNLFGNGGPNQDDIHQGAIGDCYFLSTLSGVAGMDADRIRQSVVNLGDGTFGVRFFDASGSEMFVRVDADLPVSQGPDGNLNLSYANFGHDSSIWVGIMEKAWTAARDTMNSTNPTVATGYDNIEGGFMDEVPVALGCNSVFATQHGTNPFKDGYDMLGWIQGQLAQGKMVTFGTLGKTYGGFVESHAYTVIDVVQGQDGDWYLQVRNPWGVDGTSSDMADGHDDGYVFVQATDAYWSMMQLQSSWA